MNVVDPILFQCKLNPAAAAICVPGTKFNVVSYARLAQLIHNVSRTAIAYGLSNGDVVAISVTDTIRHAALILGLTRLGVVTMSITQPAIPVGLVVDAVLSDDATPVAGAKKVVRVDDSWLAGGGTPMEDKSVYCQDDESLCRLFLTSGSIGDSKVIPQTQRTLRRLIARHDFSAGNRLPSCSRLYFAESMSAAMSMRYLVAMLSRGGTIFFYGTSPEGTVQAFDLYKVQGMITTPASLATYAQFYKASGSLQSGFDFILSNGGAMTEILSERVRAHICANLFISYGTSETGNIALGSAQMLAGNPGAVGFVMPDVTVEIVDEADNVRPSDQEGIIRIHSPYSPGEYLGNPAASAAFFRNGWFYPGDIGRLSPEGFLYVTGRLSNTLHVGGHKVSPEQIERVLTAIAGVEEAAVVTNVDENGADEIVALLIGSPKLDVRAIQGYCAANLPENFVPARYLFADALPRTPQGKLARQQLIGLARQLADRG
jgi:acyl-CoA synthetase (AMP-forming)/AMP-acid ligase II